MKCPALLLLIAFLATPTSQAGTWVLVNQGDCPGRQTHGSPGETPDSALCTPAFAGKTALCFTQVCYPGCQYIDVPTTQCHGGAEMADVYTCLDGEQPDKSGAGADPNKARAARSDD